MIATSGLAVWLADSDTRHRYRTRGFAPCAACPARGQASEPLMAHHLLLRQANLPATVRLLLIAESPPWSASETAVRHFYNPASPAPDNLFRATAAALLGDDRTRWQAAEKAAALSRLAEGGFLLLDSAKCPVNHLAPAAKRAATRTCAAHVLREELSRIRWALDAAICLVVRGTVPGAAGPVLEALELGPYVAHSECLPFPGRWRGHRARFIDALRALGEGRSSS
jgi:hypothetical protein